MISFKDWLLKFGESSALTRQRDGWARGLYPIRADFMSHSTPSPFVYEKFEKEFGSKKRKKSKGKKKK